MNLSINELIIILQLVNRQVIYLSKYENESQAIKDLKQLQAKVIHYCLIRSQKSYLQDKKKGDCHDDGPPFPSV
jgi:hypothetical protein